MMSKALFFEMYKSIIKLKEKFQTKKHYQLKEAYSLSSLIWDLPGQWERARDKAKAVSSNHFGAKHQEDDPSRREARAEQ